ncbi:hypothetical protein PG993_001587 [Apiospora rasikravindrae]|uniref:Uncharacterized protein n=1 Tax=Apiospora rasikravindrae TaxID=990691 RepID=A0ABR1UE51_9PEZI
MHLGSVRGKEVYEEEANPRPAGVSCEREGAFGGTRTNAEVAEGDVLVDVRLRVRVSGTTIVS